MVLDIDKYPQFVPWCLDGKIHEKKDMENFIEIKADLKVGKKFINEIYSSLVLYSKKKNIITVTNIGGPLKYLTNEWKFKEINNKTHLEFSINFELKNNIGAEGKNSDVFIAYDKQFDADIVIKRSFIHFLKRFIIRPYSLLPDFDTCRRTFKTNRS